MQQLCNHRNEREVETDGETEYDLSTVADNYDRNGLPHL
jgi:hypothetical protein